MVIQRLQSLILLVAVILMVVFSFCSLGQVQTPDYTFNFKATGFYYEGIATDGAQTGTFISTWYFFITSITTAVVMLIDIFLYKNLQLQKKVCLVCVLLAIACIAIAATLGYTAVEGYSVSWSSVVINPIVSLFGCVAAYTLMQSDQKKLRAADRIR